MLFEGDIHHRERGLLIGGHPPILTEVLKEIRETYDEAGKDMGKILHDVIFSLETQLENQNEDIRTFLVRAYRTEKDFENAKATLLDDGIIHEAEAVEMAKGVLTRNGTYVRTKVLSSDDEVCRIFRRDITVTEET